MTPIDIDDARDSLDRTLRPSPLVPALALVALVACASESPGPGAVSTAGPSAPGSIDPALLQPLTALGPCESAPAAVDHEPVAGLHLPDTAVVTNVERTDPLVNIQGYVPMTPVQIRVHFQRDDDLEKLHVEDEIHESEVLVSDGQRRQFVKAQAVCDLGSIFVAVVAPESAAGQVPQPAGRASTPPPGG